MELKDYYKILGVSEKATKEEIKHRFRELAKRYHPDVCKEENAEEKFKLILEAYQILYDDEKRKEYDRLRKAFFEGEVDESVYNDFEKHIQNVREAIELIVRLEMYDQVRYGLNIAGVSGGVLGGAWTGLKIAGPVGAIIGAVLGGLAGVWGSETAADKFEEVDGVNQRLALKNEMEKILNSLPPSMSKPIAEFVIVSEKGGSYKFPVAIENVERAAETSAVHGLLFGILARYGDFKTGVFRKYNTVKQVFSSFADKFREQIYQENGIYLQDRIKELEERIEWLPQMLERDTKPIKSKLFLLRLTCVSAVILMLYVLISFIDGGVFTREELIWCGLKEGLLGGFGILVPSLLRKRYLSHLKILEEKYRKEINRLTDELIRLRKIFNEKFGSRRSWYRHQRFNPNVLGAE